MTGREGREFHRKEERKNGDETLFIILARRARRTWKKLFEQLINRYLEINSRLDARNERSDVDLWKSPVSGYRSKKKNVGDSLTNVFPTKVIYRENKGGVVALCYATDIASREKPRYRVFLVIDIMLRLT